MKTKMIELAEHENITYEFADYWTDVYLDTRDEVNLGSFIEWIKEKYAARTKASN